MPHLTDDLLNTIDQPLQTAKDAQGNAYLLCDYNRDGDSFRYRMAVSFRGLPALPPSKCRV